MHWSPSHPVVGMDTAAPDLPGWIRRQTSAQPNQPGEAFTKLWLREPNTPWLELDPPVKQLSNSRFHPLLHLFYLLRSRIWMSSSPINHYIFLLGFFHPSGAAHLLCVLALVFMHIFLIKIN